MPHDESCPTCGRGKPKTIAEQAHEALELEEAVNLQRAARRANAALTPAAALMGTDPAGLAVMQAQWEGRAPAPIKAGPIGIDDLIGAVPPRPWDGK